MVRAMHASALGTVEEVRLESGLTLLCAPEPESEVFTIMLWVPAGVRTEAPGESGISHFVEHCYSLGSAHMAPREIDCVVQALGGTKNAFTSYDYTAYYENLPRSALARIIEIEADRFSWPLFPAEPVQKELEVVKEERRLRTDDTVTGPVNEKLFELAYRRHPYRNPIVGRPEDLARFDAELARRYFESRYVADRATYILVGGFELGRAVALFEKAFSPVPARTEAPCRAEPELALDSEIRWAAAREGVTSSLVSMMYHAPEIDHPDAAPMALLSTTLLGGRAGRLQRALIREQKLASSVSGGFWALRDPGPFHLSVVPQDGVSLERVEASVDETLRRFVEEGPSEDELQRAKAQRLLSKLTALESTQGRAHALGVYQTTSRRGYGAHRESFARLREVRREDVQRVAQAYLAERGRVVVWQEPARRAARAKPRPEGPAAASCEGAAPLLEPGSFPRPTPPAHAASLSPALAPGEVKRVRFGEGGTLLMQATGRLPICAVQISVEAGAYLDQGGRSGLASLTADGLRTGTTRLTEECIAESFARFGTALSVSCGLESVQLRLLARAEDLGPVLGLMLEVLTRPSFSAPVMERLRAEHLCRLRQAWSRPSELLHLGTLRALFGGHPYGRPVAGTPSGLESVSTSDVLAHYQRFYRPSRVIVAAAGAVNQGVLESALSGAFRDWAPGAAAGPAPEIPALSGSLEAHSVVIHKEAQAQAHVALAQRVCARAHEDWDQLVLLNALLGGSGLASRIPARVRTCEGLAYSARSGLSSRELSGVLTITAQSRLEGVGRTLEVIEEEVRRLLEGDLDELEFQRIKSRLRGTLPFRTETVSAKAAALLTAERHGLAPDYLERQIERIEAVTREEMLETARRHIRLDAFTRVAVAPEGPALTRCCGRLPTVRWTADDFDD